MADDKQLDNFKKEAAAKAKAAALAKLNRDKGPVEKRAEQKTANDGPVITINAKIKKVQNEEIKKGIFNKVTTAYENTTEVAKDKIAVKQSKAFDIGASIASEKSITLAKTKESISSVVVNNNETSELKTELLSANQPLLDLIKKEVRNNIGSNIIEESYINKLAKDIPTLVVSKNNFYKLAKELKINKNLNFDYFNFLHGTDYQTYMEVYVQLRSYKNGFDIAIKTKLDREYPEMDSLTSLWVGASWPESETFDLLGIKFSGNPDLHRIFLGENWVGHPLRKDYQPYEEEVVSE